MCLSYYVGFSSFTSTVSLFSLLTLFEFANQVTLIFIFKLALLWAGTMLVMIWTLPHTIDSSELLNIHVRSIFLSFTTAVGYILWCRRIFYPFGYYVLVLSFFHFSEFYVTAVTNPKNFSSSSFLLPHSMAYVFAAIASCFEFFIELYLLPSLKSQSLFTAIGLFICIAGELLRKGSMFEAGHNFSHMIQMIKKDEHILITSGVYSWMRHPSYVGWFYWSLGTQILLCNPICTIAYAFVGLNTFSERIQIEEMLLIGFFKEQYTIYQKNVPTGLPFIRGYQPDAL